MFLPTIDLHGTLFPGPVLVVSDGSGYEQLHSPWYFGGACLVFESEALTMMDVLTMQSCSCQVRRKGKYDVDGFPLSGQYTAFHDVEDPIILAGDWIRQASFP